MFTYIYTYLHTYIYTILNLYTDHGLYCSTPWAKSRKY